MTMHRDTNRKLLQRGRSLYRNWLWILAGGCACAAAALIVSLFMPNVYRATTYLLISESRLGDSARDTNLQQMAMLPTFIPFVDNDALIDESLKKLKLDQPPYNLTLDLFRRRNYLDVRTPKSTRLLELNIEFPDARHDTVYESHADGVGAEGRRYDSFLGDGHILRSFHQAGCQRRGQGNASAVHERSLQSD